MTQPEITIRVAGDRYDGWTSVVVRRSLEALASSFEVTYFDRWLDQGVDAPIHEGDACEIFVDGVSLLRGYVDEPSGDEDGETDGLQAMGRSLAGDLVDCSAIHKGGQWGSSTLLQIARDLVFPFGMSAAVNVDVGGPLTGFTLEEGETVASALERAARMKGVLVTSEGDYVIFTRAGIERANTAIARGVNVLHSERKADWKGRHSQYIVKAQVAATGGIFGTSASQRKAVATDPTVTRYRPLIVVSEDASSLSVEARATWHRNVRAGRSVKFHYTVTGWKDGRTVWRPGPLIRVTDARWSLDDDLLIVGVELQQGEEGATTKLELMDPRAFSIAQPPKPSKAGKKLRRRAAKAVAKVGA